ncbi:MAG: excinuclease subunit [Gammaproteobacteria bacterium]|jgi:excinuclease ABC subunit C|nr:excinuclease subunit [Gammaproteobacteria bacterium]
MVFDIKNFLKTLTTQPGVYQMLGEGGKVLYVGKARNIKKRVANYFSEKQKDIKTLALLKHVQDIHITITHTENEALLLECNLIKKHKPHYNVLFRDDKTFPYILITDERPYPSINFYRGNKKIKGSYFGPYPHSTAVRETIHFIQKLFGLRIASDRYSPKRTRPCLKYQIGLCSGACAGLISEKDYNLHVQHAILFLEGKNKQILEALQQEMQQASQALEYEKAAKIRDQLAQFRYIQERQCVSAEYNDADVIGFALRGIVCIQLLMIRGGRILGSQAYFPTVPIHSTKEEILTSFITQHYLGHTKEVHVIPKEIIVDVLLPEQDWLMNVLREQSKHKVVLLSCVRSERKKWLEIANASAQQSAESRFHRYTTTQERFIALLALLKLKKIDRIECFDISHTMGEATVGSCVVFNTQGAVKNDYRHFNIKEITPGDDVAAMRQVLFRRYQRVQSESINLPDVILIDGGLTQLAAAQKTLAELGIHQPILMSVAKGASRKPGLEILHIPGKPPIRLASDAPALHLIQQIRDEAHRFAITGHRHQRDRKRLRSSLEAIPGIGRYRRQALLRYFGGIQAIKHASLDELEQVPGISRSLAQRIYKALEAVEKK